MFPQFQVGPLLENPQKQSIRISSTTTSSTRWNTRDLRAATQLAVGQGFKFSVLRQCSLFLIDSACLGIAWLLTGCLGVLSPVVIFLCLSLNIAPLWLRGLYGAGPARRDYGALLQSQGVSWLLIGLLLEQGAANGLVSEVQPAYGFVASATALLVGRLGFDRITHGLRQRQIACHRVVVFSQPGHAKQLKAFIAQSSHYKVVRSYRLDRLDDPCLPELLARLSQLRVSQVFIEAAESDRQLLSTYWSLRNTGIRVHCCQCLAPELEEDIDAEREADPQRPLISRWVIEDPSPSVIVQTLFPPALSGFEFGIKRTMDGLAAFFFLLLMSPVYGAIALWIRLDSSGPIFYRQLRIGLNNRPFYVWKFRTMVTNADQLQKELEAQNETKDGVLFKIKNDPRITKAGHLLRRYSLDELPQVINVLLGEMSFVGPRPLPLRDVEKFSDLHFIRHEVLPGITGLWQVSGRSDIDNFEDVVNLDLAYMKYWSLWLDLKILLRTVGVVLQKSGAY